MENSQAKGPELDEYSGKHLMALAHQTPKKQLPMYLALLAHGERIFQVTGRGREKGASLSFFVF